MGESSSLKCSAHAYIRVEPDQAKFAMGLRGHPHRARNISWYLVSEGVIPPVLREVAMLPKPLGATLASPILAR